MSNMTTNQKDTDRKVYLVAVVEAETYDGMTDAQVAAMIREVVERAGLDGVTEIHAVRS